MRTLLATALTAAVTAGRAPPAAQAHGDHHDRRIVDYTVRSGDTLSSLAVRFPAWTDELIARKWLSAASGSRSRSSSRPSGTTARRVARPTCRPVARAGAPRHHPARPQRRRPEPLRWLWPGRNRAGRWT